MIVITNSQITLAKCSDMEEITGRMIITTKLSPLKKETHVLCVGKTTNQHWFGVICSRNKVWKKGTRHLPLCSEMHVKYAWHLMEEITITKEEFAVFKRTKT